MDSAQKASYAADTSFLGSSPQSENVQDFDTSLLGITVVDDPAIRSDTQMDLKLLKLLSILNYPIHPIILSRQKTFLM